MNRLAIPAALALAAAITVAAPADATPVATFTLPPGPVYAGVAYTYDGTASVCDKAPCSYSWRRYRPSNDRLGTTMGYGPVVTVALPAGTWNIALTVVNSYSTHGRMTASQFEDVLTPPPVP